MTAWLGAHVRSVVLAFVLLALAGVGAVLRLPVSLFPHIDFPRVVVSVDAGDRAVDQMVSQVTRPVEQALRAVPGVTGLRSTSSRGAAEVSVNFAWGADMAAATLQAESAITAILPDLPPGARFAVRRMDPTIFPVFGIALVSQTRDPVQLRDFAYYQLRPLLAAIPGVADVAVLGGRQKEYQVLADPAKLQALGLSVEDLARTLAANNVVISTGRLEDRYRLYLVLADSRLAGADDIRRTVVKTGSRGLVQLDDIATVASARAPEWTRVTAQGRDAVLVNIRQTPGANSVALVKAVKARLAENAAQIPADIRIVPFYDQSELVTAAAGSVRDAILLGALLAGGVLFLFLRSLRFMLIVALLLPSVLASTAILLGLMGMSLNMMTLGGMAAAVGLIVDDAVVMLEHVMRRLQEAHRAGRTLSPLDGAAEMIRPLIGSSLATVLVFTPLAFLSGVSGGFFKALAVTMSAALVLSLLFTLLVAPVLARAWVRPADVAAAERAERRLDRLAARYGRLLEGALRRPARVAAVVGLVLLAAGGLAYSRLGSGFMPRMDEGGFILDYYAAPGASLAETDRLLRQVEAILQATPEVESYSRRTGLQLGGGLTEANEGDFFIKLRSGRRRNIEAVMADVRARIDAEAPGLTVETAQLLADLIGDLTAVPQPIEVKLFGPDTATLREAGPAVASALEKVPGIVEVNDGLRVAGDAVIVRVDRPAAALEGLDPQAITAQLSFLVGGGVVGQVQEGEKVVAVRLWSPDDLRSRVESLSRLQLRAPDGHLLPLARIAEIRIEPGQPQVTRENLQPLVAVTARLEARDLGSAMRDVRRAVQTLKLGPDVRVAYGGLYAEQQRSFRDLALVFAAALGLVALLSLYLFESWIATASVIATVLLAAASVFVGLWATRTELNISAMMGLTMVLGIVAELAIFFFSELRGRERVDAAALAEAGRARLRPILMSALIASLALAPLALGLGAGSAMQKPLAIAIIAGLVAGAPLILLFMPAFYRAISALRPGVAERQAEGG